MTCAPTATRTRDLPLIRRSSRDRRPPAASLVSCGLHGAWRPASVSGFCQFTRTTLRPVRDRSSPSAIARGSHAVCLGALFAVNLWPVPLWSGCRDLR